MGGKDEAFRLDSVAVRVVVVGFGGNSSEVRDDCPEIGHRNGKNGRIPLRTFLSHYRCSSSGDTTIEKSHVNVGAINGKY